MNTWQKYLYLLGLGVTRLSNGTHLAFSSVGRLSDADYLREVANAPCVEKISVGGGEQPLVSVK